MPIKIHSNVNISKVRSDKGQRCVHCGHVLPRGLIALTINKITAGDTPMNLWIHLRCFEDFSNKINEEIKKHGPEVMAMEL